MGSIGKFLGETVMEGVVFRWLAKGMDFFKKGLLQPEVATYIKDQLKSKGLDDEALFGFELALTAFGNNNAKKKMFLEALNKLERYDKLFGTRYARNFRLEIALDPIGNPVTKKTKLGKNGKPEEIIEGPDPKYIRPGVKILRDMAKICDTEDDFMAYMMAIGSMQDAPFGKIDETIFWLKTNLPKAYEQLKQLDAKLQTAVANRHQSYSNRSAWRKIFLN
jgi:hypothetical protein